MDRWESVGGGGFAGVRGRGRWEGRVEEGGTCSSNEITFSCRTSFIEGGSPSCFSTGGGFRPI